MLRPSSVEQAEPSAPVVFTDAVGALNFLLRVSFNIRALQKATVFYRIMLGRQLVAIRENQLWRDFERRDYRLSPAGKALWDKGGEARHFYKSWYDFLENGFECTTGLHRETGYGAIKLAKSKALSDLPDNELQNFTRLANAIRIVDAERKGVKITSELIQKAMEMPTLTFQNVLVAPVKARRLSLTHGVSADDNTSPPVRGQSMVDKMTSNGTVEIQVVAQITTFFETAAAVDIDVVDDFWEMLRGILLEMNQPIVVLRSIMEAYRSASSKTFRTEHELRGKSRLPQAVQASA
jgi:hypothetical protein